jgi:hypothetical protein
LKESLKTAWIKRHKLRIKGNKLKAKSSIMLQDSDRIRVKGYKLRAKATSLWADAYKIWAKGDQVWADAIIKAYGNVPIAWHYRMGFNSSSCLVNGIEMFEALD